MITNDSPRVRSLLRQAERNVEVGKIAAAEELYRQIIEEAPESAAAWLGLAGVLQNEAERQAAYERVLELDPDNVVATAVLNGEPLPEPQVEPEVESASPSADGKGEEQAAAQAASAATSSTTAVSAAPSTVERPEPRYEVLDPEVQLYCYRHPDRGTSLRCYKCNKPICSECTVKTPVGYLCPECYREAEDAFFNARPFDYVLATAVALPISLLAGYLVMRFSGGFFFILILFFIGGAIGGVIGRVTKRVIGQRRGRYIPHLVAACVIIGVMVWALPVLLGALFVNPGALFSLIGPGVYLATAVGSAFFWAR
jgi:hypothetical protein